MRKQLFLISFIFIALFLAGCQEYVGYSGTSANYEPDNSCDSDSCSSTDSDQYTIERCGIDDDKIGDYCNTHNDPECYNIGKIIDVPRPLSLPEMEVTAPRDTYLDDVADFANRFKFQTESFYQQPSNEDVLIASADNSIIVEILGGNKNDGWVECKDCDPGWQVRTVFKDVKGVKVQYEQFRRLSTGEFEEYIKIDFNKLQGKELESAKESYANIVKSVQEGKLLNSEGVYAQKEILSMKRLYFDGLVGSRGQNAGAYISNPSIVSQINDLRKEYIADINEITAQRKQNTMDVYLEKINIVNEEFTRDLNTLLYGVRDVDGFTTDSDYNPSSVNVAESNPFSDWARTITPEDVLSRLTGSDYPEMWVPRPEETNNPDLETFTKVVFGPSN